MVHVWHFEQNIIFKIAKAPLKNHLKPIKIFLYHLDWYNRENILTFNNDNIYENFRNFQGLCELHFPHLSNVFF